jgi:regulatory protein
MIRRGSLSPEQALQKARHYCGYQERCHQEVKEKLYSFGLRRQDVDMAIASLIEENYLNEQRFAIQFAGGHFRMKQWGRIKIRYELKQRQVSEYNIKIAMATIPEEDYAQTLTRLADRKMETLQTESNLFVRKKKLHDYLLNRGYEQDLITADLSRFSDI